MADKQLDIDKFSKIRLFRHQDSEQSFAFAEENIVGLVGNADVNILSSDEANFINGPVGFGAFPQDIRFGGMWQMNPALIACIPSSIATPVPTLLFSPPGLELMKDMAAACTAMASFIA